MTETAQRRRGGKAFHSILEPHFDFIRELRLRRKKWNQITDLLLTEKGIRVTVYAPYLFFRRKLKRAAKPHWENSTVDSQPTHPSAAATRPQSHSAPLPPPPTFKRPHRFNLETDEFT